MAKSIKKAGKVKENNNNHFIDGFFWGAVIGGAAVFLLGTKKGKQVLKIVTDEAIPGATKLEEIIKSCKEDFIDHKKDKHESKRLFKGIPKK